METIVTNLFILQYFLGVQSYDFYTNPPTICPERVHFKFVANSSEPGFLQDLQDSQDSVGSKPNVVKLSLK